MAAERERPALRGDPAMTVQSTPVNPGPAPAGNAVALAGFIVGIVTVIAVVLRPYWLISDVLGLAAITLGFVGMSTASRTGSGKRFAIWAVALGFTPLIPLVLVWAARLDYY